MVVFSISFYPPLSTDLCYYNALYLQQAPLGDNHVGTPGRNAVTKRISGEYPFADPCRRKTATSCTRNFVAIPVYYGIINIRDLTKNTVFCSDSTADISENAV